MSKTLELFDATWLSQTQEKKSNDSWITAVIDSSEGSLYLDVLRVWFAGFPLSSIKDRRALNARLESFNTSDHLGGVNELSWWEFMRRTNLQAEPIPTTTKPRPDFKVLTPSEFFAYCNPAVNGLSLHIHDRREFNWQLGIFECLPESAAAVTQSR
jgi:hypothetical protein